MCGVQAEIKYNDKRKSQNCPQSGYSENQSHILFKTPKLPHHRCSIQSFGRCAPASGTPKSFTRQK